MFALKMQNKCPLLDLRVAQSISLTISQKRHNGIDVQPVSYPNHVSFFRDFRYCAETDDVAR